MNFIKKFFLKQKIKKNFSKIAELAVLRSLEQSTLPDSFNVVPLIGKVEGTICYKPTSRKINIIIYSERPGILIGKRGVMSEEIKEGIQKQFPHFEVSLEFKFVDRWNHNYFRKDCIPQMIDEINEHL